MRVFGVQLLLALALSVISTAQGTQGQAASIPQTDQSQAERHKAHRREMGSRLGTNIYPKISHLLEKKQGDIDLSCDSPEGIYIKVGTDDEIQSAVCQSTLIVAGRMGDSVSDMTDDGRFIYTDWSLAVDDVLMNNGKDRVIPGDSITIAVLGGRLTIDGRKITATCDPVKFEPRKEYLLFLRLSPESGTYSPATSAVGFSFLGDSALGLLTHFRDKPEWSSYDRQRVLSSTRTGVEHVASACYRSEEK